MPLDDEVLELGRRPRRRPSNDLTPIEADGGEDSKPLDLDAHGDSENESPGRPRLRVRSVVAVTAALCVGALGWWALAGWRAEPSAPSALRLHAVVTEAEPPPVFSSDAIEQMNVQVLIVNSGEHPVSVELVTFPGWRAVEEHGQAKLVKPGVEGPFTYSVQSTCNGDRPAPLMSVQAAVTTEDGRHRQVKLPLVQGSMLSDNWAWMCGGFESTPAVSVALGRFVAATDESVTLELLDLSANGDSAVVTAVRWTTPAFSVELPQGPIELRPDERTVQPTIWRITDCRAVENFETGELAVNATLGDGTTTVFEASGGAPLASLARVVAEVCA